MFNTRSFYKYWLPLLIWMMVIFSASGDTQSFQRSSRIIGPLLHFLFPNLSDVNVDHVVTFARKCAHLTEYAILAFLFWRAMRQPAKSDPRPWNWPLAGVAVVFVALYAATDEYHQSFVPGREGSVRDVLIDTLGAILGMLFLWLIGIRRTQTAQAKAISDGQKSPVSSPGKQRAEPQIKADE